MHPARLFVVCGLPGSGKTTRAIEIAERFGAIRMCADDWMEDLGIDIWDTDMRARVEVTQGEMTCELLRTAGSVVVERGSWTRAERDELRRRALDAGALVHLEFLDAPVDVLWDRLSERAREQQVGSRAITRADVEAWASIIQRPSPEELATYDPFPTVRAGELPGSPAFPYGSWRPQSRPR